MGRAGNTAFNDGTLGQEMISRRRDAAAPAIVELQPGRFVRMKKAILPGLDPLIKETVWKTSPLVAPGGKLRDRINFFRHSKELIRHELETSFGAYMDGWLDSDSPIVSEQMLDLFGLRLAGSHSFYGSTVEKTTFEFLFVSTLNAVGRDAYKTENPTHAGEDVVIDNVTYSLKTEGGRRAKPNTITISKLMEAAWCQGLTSRQQAVDLIPRILEHLSQYKRILVLRNLDAAAYDSEIEPEQFIRYSLVEIPKHVLEEMRNLKVRDFSSPRRTRKGSTTAHVKIEGEPAFTLRFDGSDGKVRIENLNSDLCRMHAYWDVTHPKALKSNIYRTAASTMSIEKMPPPHEVMPEITEGLPVLVEDISAWETRKRLAERLNERHTSLEDRLTEQLRAAESNDSDEPAESS